jgi:hypothetical protein
MRGALPRDQRSVGAPAPKCASSGASRRHAAATTPLKDVRQIDGYAAYNGFAAESSDEEIVWLGRRAHARRNAFEVQEEELREAKLPLRFIGWIYRREDRRDEADAKAGSDTKNEAPSKVSSTGPGRVNA